MITGIDHLVIATPDPDAAVEELGAVLGLPVGGGGRHERLGTFNRLIWLGDTYLELIGVDDLDIARDTWIGAPTVRALEAGGGLATWAVATDAIDADVERWRAVGSDLPEPVPGERARLDGAIVRWRLAAAPHLAADAPPFLIEHDLAGAEWTLGDRAGRAAHPARLTVLELALDDVPAAIRRMARTVGLRFRPSLAGQGARDADVGAQIVRLRPRRGRDDPTTTVWIRNPATAPSTTDCLGCRWIVSA